jgi:flagellar hook-length control protein FliK
VTGPVQITLANPPQSTGGAQTITIHLKPDELGRVEIRIERPADGPARIELAVERPETLLRLVHDQPQLQQALDQAGISPSGRTIQFSLAPDTSSGSAFGASASGDSSFGGNGQRFQQGGYAGHASRSLDEADLPIIATAWARTGLDITA